MTERRIPVPVYQSRFTPGLGPGDGHKIEWSPGDRAVVIDGGRFNRDKGRIVIITSGRVWHDDAPGHYVVEAYFEDDPRKKRWAMLAKRLWPQPKETT